MDHPCPRCRTVNPDVARYCRHCGLPLLAAPGGFLGAGRTRHPEPLVPPNGYEPFENAPDLHFHWQAAWGGEVLLGTETLEVTAFNAGYGLEEIVVRIRGENEAGKMLVTVEREIEQWPRGGQVELEIPSWELPDPAKKLVLTLVSAEFGPDS